LAYEVGSREPTLSFAHHRIIASRPNRLDWLKRAADAAPKVDRKIKNGDFPFFPLFPLFTHSQHLQMKNGNSG